MSDTPVVTDPEEKQAAIDKAKADARQAEAAAAKAELELEEARSPAARAAADAAQRKAEAESNKDAAAARRDEVAALVPDLTKVTASTLEEKGDQPLFGVVMAQRALAGAAEDVVPVVTTALKGVAPVRLLVTDDADLATSDGAYLQVTNALEGLIAAANALLPGPVQESPPVPAPAPEAPRPSFAPLPLIGAVASALPGVLSLFAAKRSVTSAAATVPDLSAAAAVIGALRAGSPDWTILDDQFRVLDPEGRVATLVRDATSAYQHLLARKAELEAAGGHGDDVDRLDETAKAIETFLGAAGAVPAGGTASLLGQAMLREQLHAESDRVTHVLLVKADGGALHEAVDNRPLWFKDKFSIVAAVSLSYILISTEDGRALAAATVSKAAVGRGTIGSELNFDDAT